jgi:hypothetical protein
MPKAKYVSNGQMRPLILVIASESSLNDKGDQNNDNSGRIVLYLNRFQGESFWFLPEAQREGGNTLNSTTLQQG